MIIERATVSQIEPGDIVAFLCPDTMGKMEKWAHRVIKISSSGLLTRGDNNLGFDSQLLTAKQLLGRVTHVEHNGVVRPVQGGWFGLLRARILWSKIHVRNLVVKLGRRPYKLLRKSRLVPRIWRPIITRITLETDRGELIKFVSQDRTVARWWPDTGRFECRWPYDLVIFPPDSLSDQTER
ncbi:MAG: hypothetical protein JXA42_09430 [Anaerolineales bacterium]|nr:hypothetical protein [Anaerolineales bacterium]